MTITSGDRFYAILQKPEEASYTLPYLDEFYIEVGSANTDFDRITYVRLHQQEKPVAVYVGEIQMSPAPSRTTPGQMIVVKVRDDFRNATLELKRLYPRFEGTIATALDLRSGWGVFGQFPPASLNNRHSASARTETLGWGVECNLGVTRRLVAHLRIRALSYSRSRETCEHEEPVRCEGGESGKDPAGKIGAAK